MMNQYKRKLHNTNGFSLVELIVVIVIVLILSATVVPAVSKYIGKAKEASLVSEAKEVLNASYYGISQA